MASTPLIHVVDQLRRAVAPPESMNRSDSQLLDAFLGRRDEAAFADLVRRHGAMVLGVCQRVVGRLQDAEDAFQATFLVLARKANSIRPREKLPSWLYGVALRPAMAARRQLARRDAKERQVIAMPHPMIGADFDRGEALAVLDEELSRLPEKYREAVILCELDGYSRKEAAAKLRIVEGTLSSRLAMARKLLARRLARRGLALAAGMLAMPLASAMSAPAVSPVLVQAAVRTAVLSSSADVAKGLISSKILVVAEGAMKAMLLTKLKKSLTLIAVMGIIAVATAMAILPQGTDAANQPIAVASEKTEAKAQGDAVRKRFEELAGQLKFFPTGDLSYGRGARLQQGIPKKVSEPWLKLLAAISTGKEEVTDLVSLLKHQEPKVRTLALGALYLREDPRVLPHIAELVADKESTVPDLQILRAGPILKHDDDLLPQDYHKQSVGRVAEMLLKSWIGAAGYEVKDFSAYWEARKDRKFCASWFLARLYRAGQATSAFDEKRAPLIRAIRKEVDALAELDRDWTLIWLAAHHHQSLSPRPVQIFATPEERLAAAKQLGPGRLMDLIFDKEISSDPDLAPKTLRSRGRDDLIIWVLRNAGKLLRAEDAPAILAAEQALRDRPPACAIAAAELQPHNARKWLREAFKRYAKDYQYQAYHRADLAAGLWRIVGESEMDYLADWFYGEKVDKNPHSPQTEMFLQAIKGVRAPADRKLVARLITDARFDKLDYQSLRSVAEVVNGWAKVPVIPVRDLRPNWEKGTWGPESAADLKVVAGWRESLKRSVSEWNR